MNRSIRKATAATINSQVCSGTKEMACPAVLKMSVTIELMSPGKLDAVFLPISFRPIPMPLPSVYWAFGIAPITAPMTVPTPRTVAVTVMPYFLSTSMMHVAKALLQGALSHWQAGLAVAFFRSFFTSSLMVSGCFIFDICNFQILLDFSVKFRILIILLLNYHQLLWLETFFNCFWQRGVYLSIFREKCGFASFKANNHKFSFFGTFPPFEMSGVRNLPSSPYSEYICVKVSFLDAFFTLSWVMTGPDLGSM